MQAYQRRECFHKMNIPGAMDALPFCQYIEKTQHSNSGIDIKVTCQWYVYTHSYYVQDSAKNACAEWHVFASKM